MGNRTHSGPEDDFVLGIVSADPSVVGDVYDDQWAGTISALVFHIPLHEKSFQKRLWLPLRSANNFHLR